MKQLELREFLGLLDRGLFPSDIIKHGYPEKVIIRKVEKLTRRGYLEYGVSPRYAWLTDKGRAAARGELHKWKAENE